MQETEPCPTLGQAVRAELDTQGSSRYWADLVGDQIRPRSWAASMAAEITGAEEGSAEHHAVWTVLVAAGQMGSPVVGRPDSGVSLAQTVTRAAGGNPARTSHVVAVRFRQICDRILGSPTPQDVTGLVVRLCQSASGHVQSRDLPDPLLLASDLTRALSPKTTTRADLVTSWQTHAARTR